MVSQQGRFGRIPNQTIDLMEKTVTQVRTEVLSVLPAQASQGVRADALETVLAVVLRDWHENNNTTGLLASDVEDLQHFVRLAVTIAGNDLNGQGRPVFTAILKGLLNDWLANWNAPGDPGPPGH